MPRASNLLDSIFKVNLFYNTYNHLIIIFFINVGASCFVFPAKKDTF